MSGAPGPNRAERMPLNGIVVKRVDLVAAPPPSAAAGLLCTGAAALGAAAG